MYKDETIWATQRAMVTLFDCSTDNTGLHLKNIFSTEELDKEATTEIFSAVQTYKSREFNRMTTFYSLDAIIFR